MQIVQKQFASYPRLHLGHPRFYLKIRPHDIGTVFVKKQKTIEPRAWHRSQKTKLISQLAI